MSIQITFEQKVISNDTRGQIAHPETQARRMTPTENGDGPPEHALEQIGFQRFPKTPKTIDMIGSQNTPNLS